MSRKVIPAEPAGWPFVLRLQVVRGNMRRFFKWAGGTLAILVTAAAVGLLFRSDPIGPVPGKGLSGEAVPFPGDWSACSDHQYIAIETRPDDPHSVTTICFLCQGELIIPASDGGDKDWPAHVVADPRVRIKMGDSIYLGAAARIADPIVEDVAACANSKYPGFADLGPEELVDMWFFRVSQRPGDQGRRAVQAPQPAG